MSTLTASPAPQGEQEPAHAPVSYEKCAGVGHFWLRRIHSLFGLLFGGYVVVHLTVNATGLWPRVYQQNVDKIHDMEPMLPLIEIVAIFIPLLVHAIYGTYIASAGIKFNTMKYNYGGNVRYWLQRMTAWVLLAFIAFHIATLHKWGFQLIYNVFGGAWFQTWGGKFDGDNRAFQSTVMGIRGLIDPNNPLAIGNILVMAFYLLGVWSACFHFANGLWTSAIAWGLTTTARAQKRWGDACLALGLVVTLVGTIAWAAFTIAPAAQGPVSRWNEETKTYRVMKTHSGEFVRVKADTVPGDAELP